MPRHLIVSFEDAVRLATDALKQGGLGVITEIDVWDTVKKEIGVDFRDYPFLGACNPHIAQEAHQIEDKFGTMPPRTVVVQDIDGGRIEIAAIDRAASMMEV